MIFRPVFIISKYRIILNTFFGIVNYTVASVTYKYTRIFVYLVIKCLQMNADITIYYYF